MPKRKRYATRKRRRTYRKFRRRKRYRRALRRSYVPSGISTTRAAKVRFVTNTSINAPLGILQTAYYVANSAYNPTDASVSVDSPMSWQLWKSMYQQYCVLGSKIMAIPQQTDTAMSESSYVGVLLSERIATLYTNRAQYMESMASSRERGTWTLMAGQRNQPRAIKARYSAKKWWNFTNVKDADTQWVATNASPAPTAQAYFVVWCQGTNPLADVTVNFQVIIDYIVLFREPINID